MPRTPDDFLFFWKPDQAHGWASQWYPSPFAARVALADGTEREVVFPTAEHWMMAQKALLFGDEAVFLRIAGLPPAPDPARASRASAGTARERPRPRTRAKRATKEGTGTTEKKPRPPSAKAVKALGRRVRGFDEETWLRERGRIVLEGSLHKFRAHEALRRALLETGERELVEASPLDRVWGVGLGVGRAAETCVSEETRAGWGLNLLGVALGEARRILRDEEGQGDEGGVVDDAGTSG